MPEADTPRTTQPAWEPTYHLRIGWTPFEVKGRISDVDAAARALLGREVFVIMPDGTQRAIGIVQSVASENRYP